MGVRATFNRKHYVRRIMERSEVLIVGGGAIGLATALELALRGISVTVLSRNFQEAALYAAAGMLAPQAEGLLPGPMLELCLRSRNLYPEWTRKLESLTGVSSEYWPCGILAPQFAQDSPPYDWSDKNAAWCDRPSLDILQTGLGEEVAGGWWFPEDGQVNNRVMAAVMHTALEGLGVTIQEGVTVEQIRHNNNQVTEVQTSEGIYQAGSYVLASGAWAGELLPIPVVPRKGQMLSVRTGTAQQPLQHVLFGRDVYIVPRHCGQVIVGATNEQVGFAPHNTPAGVQQLLGAATRLFPPLNDWVLEHCWWGFRPATPDEMPILGLSPYKNLVLATGHYRNGILLTPITAQLITNWIVRQQLDPILEAFRWDRFVPEGNL
jgi:glycine oxidase ThiO